MNSATDPSPKPSVEPVVTSPAHTHSIHSTSAFTVATSVLIMLSGTHQAEVWETLPPLPEPIGGAACVSTGHSILVAGGTNWPNGKKNWVKTIRSFDPATSQWKVAGELPSPRAYAVHDTHRSMLLLAGGSDGVKTHLDLFSFPRKDEPPGQLSHAAVYAGGGILRNELILAGGSPDQANLSGLSNVTFAVHTESLQARQLPPMPGPGIGIAASAVCGERLFIFGGARWDPSTGSVVNVASTWILSTRPDQWSPAAPYPAETRGAVAIALDDRHIYVGGGYRSSPEGFTNEAFLYETTRNQFLPAQALPISGMTSLVRHGNHIYCIGGEDKKQHRSDGFWRAKISTLLKATNSP